MTFHTELLRTYDFASQPGAIRSDTLNSLGYDPRWRTLALSRLKHLELQLLDYPEMLDVTRDKQHVIFYSRGRDNSITSSHICNISITPCID